MNLLLDTHSFLWFVDGNPKLSENARAEIERTENQLFLSVASLWEMAIKISLGKLSLRQPFSAFMNQQLSLNGIGLLNIALEHTHQVIALPYHHRDPFDRLFVAQAKIENLPIVSGDPIFDAYGVQRVW